jgi:hypothetical protein
MRDVEQPWILAALQQRERERGERGEEELRQQWFDFFEPLVASIGKPSQSLTYKAPVWEGDRVVGVEVRVGRFKFTIRRPRAGVWVVGGQKAQSAGQAFWSHLESIKESLWSQYQKDVQLLDRALLGKPCADPEGVCAELASEDQDDDED